MSTRETNKVKIFALGGVGESGKNMYVLETNSQIFVIDAGLMIPADEMLGIDMVIPDITYLVDNKEKVKGIFLTHGHEEHIGALPYILRKLNVPVYGTNLTLKLVKEELEGVNTPYSLHEITHESNLEFDGINISFFRTTHSIPGSVGVIIDTPQGAVVHTGDYKFDPTSANLFGADLDKMAQIGKKGVLCLLSDSVNAERPGFSGSEQQVGQEFSEAFYKASGRVLVVTYATNIQRTQGLLQAATESGRKVAFVGAKIQKMVEIAQDLGYLTLPEDVVVSFNEISKLPPSEVVIVTSSSQGEPVSALVKIAKGTHKQIQVTEGDTVILAAAPTPATEISIAKSVDLIYRAGANVVSGKNKMHVSGHGSQEDIKLMLNLMKPKYVIPVHGEYRMQKAHAKVAQSIGIPEDHIFLLDKGEAIDFYKGEASYGSKVYAGNVLIDGLGIGDIGNIVLRDRRLLSQDGILVVVVTLSRSRNVLIAGPEIISRGFVYVRESEKLLVEATDLVKGIMQKCIEDQIVDWSSLKINIRDSLNQFLYEKTKRRPMILPIIMEI
ncbi:RNase J family beta-CASP ribonuclease [Bacillus suaedaesalsae]|uniref:Ribonuclease J n=1 Tax=Bacillus suaedaesalsae TaxID=2810349 RepID=A0ABS2DIZ9_9BACI|nr:ribonuclease J [Bacillus suaedaesalsae]